MIQVNAMVYSLAAALAIGAFGGYKAGATIYQNKLLKFKSNQVELANQAAAASAARRAENQAAIAVVDDNQAQVIVRTEVIEHEVEKEVIRYIQRPPDPGIYLDPDWVRIHNRSAADPRVPDAAATSAADVASAAPGDVLPVVTRNYAKHHACANQVAGLQNYIRALLD